MLREDKMLIIGPDQLKGPTEGFLGEFAELYEKVNITYITQFMQNKTLRHLRVHTEFPPPHCIDMR